MPKLIPSNDPSDLWKNRRTMAYMAIAGLFLEILTAALKSLSSPQADLLGDIAYVFGAVILAYTGGVVWDAANRRRRSAPATDEPEPRAGLSRRKRDPTAEELADRRAASAPALEGD